MYHKANRGMDFIPADCKINPLNPPTYRDSKYVHNYQIKDTNCIHIASSVLWRIKGGAL